MKRNRYEVRKQACLTGLANGELVAGMGMIRNLVLTIRPAFAGSGVRYASDVLQCQADHFAQARGIGREEHPGQQEAGLEDSPLV